MSLLTFRVLSLLVTTVLLFIISATLNLRLETLLIVLAFVISVDLRAQVVFTQLLYKQEMGENNEHNQ